MKTEKIKLSDIRTDGGTQSRQVLNEDHSRELAEHVDGLPPAVVFFDGDDYWLADGFHRYEAHRIAKRERMTCETRVGTRDDAVVFAAGANADHGLRRTNADKEKSVRMLLALEKWRGRSNREVAEAAKVSHAFVNSLRAVIQPPKSGEKREGKDKKDRPAAPSREESTGNRFQLTDTSDVPDPSDDSENAVSHERELRKPVSPDAPEVNPFAPVQVLDKDGNRVPKHLWPVFQTPDPADAYLNAHQQLTKLHNGYLNTPHAAVITAQQRQVLKDGLHNTREVIVATRPHGVCPYCVGKDRKCSACKGLGWLCKSVYLAAPADLRKKLKQ